MEKGIEEQEKRCRIVDENNKKRREEEKKKEEAIEQINEVRIKQKELLTQVPSTGLFRKMVNTTAP